MATMTITVPTTVEWHWRLPRGHVERCVFARPATVEALPRQASAIAIGEQLRSILPGGLGRRLVGEVAESFAALVAKAAAMGRERVTSVCRAFRGRATPGWRSRLAGLDQGRVGCRGAEAVLRFEFRGLDELFEAGRATLADLAELLRLPAVLCAELRWRASRERLIGDREALIGRRRTGQAPTTSNSKLTVSHRPPGFAWTAHADAWTADEAYPSTFGFTDTALVTRYRPGSASSGTGADSSRCSPGWSP
jgi:hypothetical protein